MIQLKNAEMKWKAQSPNSDFDSEAVTFGWGNPQNPSSRELHKTTVGLLRQRNAENGSNYARAAQFFLVMLYSYWDEEYRPVLAQALGIKRNENKKCESCQRELSGPKNGLQVPVFGDIRLLRIGIVHHHGILKPSAYRKLEVLRLRKPINLGLLLHFRGLSLGQEIRLFPADVLALLTFVRSAVDEIVVAAGGNDPNYRAFKKVKAALS